MQDSEDGWGLIRGPDDLQLVILCQKGFRRVNPEMGSLRHNAQWRRVGPYPGPGRPGISLEVAIDV